MHKIAGWKRVNGGWCRGHLKRIRRPDDTDRQAMGGFQVFGDEAAIPIGSLGVATGLDFELFAYFILLLRQVCTG